MSEMKKGISVVLLTRNEERNIEACLKSCTFADEIIVVDDGSTDRTVAIAQACGARVFHRALAGDWGAQKNFAIAQATQYWVYLIDADERVTPDLAQKIQECTQHKEDRAYWVQRHNRFQHIRAEHGSMRPDWVCRLVPRAHVSVYGQVHEEVRSDCPADHIQGDGMIHYPYHDWDQYFRKFNTYTTLSAEKYKEQGKNVSFFGGVVVKPIWAFVKIYFFDKGFLDGRMGFVFALYHAFYTMTKYVKYHFVKNYNGEL